MKELYFPTGNEYVSIPTLREETAAIESFSCLHMGAKGLSSSAATVRRL